MLVSLTGSKAGDRQFMMFIKCLTVAYEDVHAFHIPTSIVINVRLECLREIQTRFISLKSHELDNSLH